jgi:transposase-like protein
VRRDRDVLGQQIESEQRRIANPERAGGARFHEADEKRAPNFIHQCPACSGDLYFTPCPSSVCVHEHYLCEKCGSEMLLDRRGDWTRAVSKTEIRSTLLDLSVRTGITNSKQTT